MNVFVGNHLTLSIICRIIPSHVPFSSATPHFPSDCSVTSYLGGRGRHIWALIHACMHHVCMHASSIHPSIYTEADRQTDRQTDRMHKSIKRKILYKILYKSRYGTYIIDVKVICYTTYSPKRLLT